jgi:hypothetical protein
VLARCARRCATSGTPGRDPGDLEGPIQRTREGGSEWETIKILLEGDGNSNKMNTSSDSLPKLAKPT